MRTGVSRDLVSLKPQAEPNDFSVIDEDEIADILQVTVLPPDLRQKLLKVGDIHEDVYATVLLSLDIGEIQQAQRNDPVLGQNLVLYR